MADIAVRLGLDTSSGQVAVTNLANVTKKEMQRVQRSLKDVNALLKAQASATKVATDAAAGMHEAAKAAEHFNLSTVGARRELAVLAHEATQGQWKNFGGSLLVLAERTDAMGAIMSATGLAIGATAGAVALMGYAAMEGAKHQEALARALKFTGNAAGQTEDSLRAVAVQAARATGASQSAAGEVAKGLAGSGAFSPTMIQKATEAVLNYAKATGTTAEESAQHFGKMRENVLKWATEEDKSAHMLTGSLYEQIRAAEKAGDSNRAMTLTLDALKSHTDPAAQSAGYFARAWRAAGEAIDSAKRSAMHLGEKDSTGDLIAKQQAAIQGSREALAKQAGNAQAVANIQAILVKQQTELARLQGVANAEAVKAAGEAKRAEVNGKAVKVREELDAQLDRVRSIKNQSAALAELRRKFDEAAAGGAAFTAAEKAALIKETRDKFTPEGWHKPSAIRDGGEQTKHDFLRSEIASYAEIDKAAREAAEAEAKRTEQLTIRLGEQAATAEKFVAGLYEETQAVKLDATAHKVLTEQLRIEEERRKTLASLGTGASQSEIERVNAQAAAAAARAQAAGNEARKRMGSPEFGASRAMEKFAKDAADEAANAEHFVTGALDKMSLALEHFVTTGKLNFSDLFASMAADYLRALSRMAVAEMLPGGGGLAGLGKLFTGGGGGFGSATGSPTLDAGIAAISGFAANGGHVNAGSSYLVGEQGIPELFKPTGSGDIVPLSQLGGAGGPPSVVINQGGISIGAGVSRAEVAAAVKASNAAAIGAVKRLVSTGRLT